MTTIQRAYDQSLFRGKQILQTDLDFNTGVFYVIIFQGSLRRGFQYSLLMRLVSVAALLKRYSPSPHPLLRLLSHVPALAYSN
jgi:hypothetical protein